MDYQDDASSITELEMITEERMWRLIELLAMAFLGLYGCYVMYDINRVGPSLEKRIVKFSLPASHPMADLGLLGSKATLSLAVDGAVVNNFITTVVLLVNKGDTPILASDFHEPLSANVDSRWKIVAVSNIPSLRTVPCKWERVSDVRFEAAPLLLNPNDAICAVVYLTDTQYATTTPSGKRESPTIDWKVRIVGLREIDDGVDVYEELANINALKVEHGPATITLKGWGIPAMVAIGLLFQLLYLHNLYLLGFIRRWNWRSGFWIAFVTFTSFAAAESIVTYAVVPGWAYAMVGTHLWNLPWIVLHIVLFTTFMWKSRKKLQRKSAAPLIVDTSDSKL